MEKEREVWTGPEFITLPPHQGQISPDLSIYQKPVSELYVKPSQHHRVPWLIDPQFPHCLTAFQSTCPSQSLTTEGSVRPRKGNSSLLSSGSSCISIGDSLDPSSTSIGFSGVPGMGTGGGNGDGDWNGGRTGRGSGEGSHARPLWFFLKCIRSRRDFFTVIKEYCGLRFLLPYFVFHSSYRRMDVVDG